MCVCVSGPGGEGEDSAFPRYFTWKWGAQLVCRGEKEGGKKKEEGVG